MTKQEEFIKGLKKLTLKTGIVIGGCGCCGSPFLRELAEVEKNGNYDFDSIGNDKVTWREKL